MQNDERTGATASRGLPSRRRFLKALAVVGIGGRTLIATRDARAAVYAAKEASGAAGPWPSMPRRKLGRTGFEASRLVFGCGAALSRGRNDTLLHAAFDAGINVFDVGTRRYYDDAEKNLAPFLKTVREEIFLISKGVMPFEPHTRVTPSQAKEAAASWLEQLDDSLRELDQDHVDAYYLMASNNPTFIASDEVATAFEQAKQAGKVRHLGLSTHQNAQRVLEAAAETGRYNLATIAITPGGWYDWEDKAILAGSPPMKQLEPVLAKARASGIGLIGMKAGRYLAGRKFLGWGKPDAFDEFYTTEFRSAPLSPFQKSYAFVLEHGLDAVNADMQSFGHLSENVVAAATSSRYFVV